MMGGTALFLEQFQPVSVIVPVNLAGQANDGDWIDIRDTDGIVFILFKAVSTAGEDPILVFRSATSAGGANAANLDVPNDKQRNWKKQGASLADIGGRPWADADGDVTDDGALTNGTLAEHQALVVVDLHIEDIPENHTHVTCNIANTGAAAQIGCVLAIVKNRWHRRPSKAVSAVG